MARLLLTSDLHLTDKPRDAYRWEFLRWFASLAKERQVDGIAILGDVTDAKDRHSAVLVKQVVHHMTQLAQCAPLVLLKGNHDYTDPQCPFFGFLNTFPGITYVTNPSVLSFGEGRQATRVYCHPHTRGPILWSLLSPDRPRMGTSLALFHQTFTGASASNGYIMEGLDPSCLQTVSRQIQVYSGDIHVPQMLGRVTYVGSPYHVHFGDRFEPRVVLWTPTKPVEFSWNGVRRHVVTIHMPDDLLALEIAKGDQVKVRLALARAYYADWSKYHQAVEAIARQQQWELHGVALVPYAPQRKVPPTASRVTRKPLKTIVVEYADREKLDHVTRQHGKRLVEAT